LQNVLQLQQLLYDSITDHCTVNALNTGPDFARIPVGAGSSAAVLTGPEAHPVSYKMRTGIFPGEKRPERDVDHPPQSSAEVNERVE
jgi:hypothetical protein